MVYENLDDYFSLIYVGTEPGVYYDRIRFTRQYLSSILSRSGIECDSAPNEPFFLNVRITMVYS